ncbi:hypothetical protein OOT00_05255 [Desulfobotulus sp. H1]|uniref:Uncharacterized protein n=1 Tax=Desulfobotulus pelophilus TaxID=2823377 RepID=A0ABT3N8M8_9BACT|nr:hypothetical protein [Desulfobotulus pelophilus]MCW7753392.1 hypothetical protein [Desulfobotulus pelophilus]
MKRKRLFFVMAFWFFLSVQTVSADYFSGDRILELRNMTGQRIDITKSRNQQFQQQQVQWHTLSPGQVSQSNVLQGSYLHIRRHLDDDASGRYQSFRLGHHADFRWFWLVKGQKAGNFMLDADYERARGRDASR